MEREDSAEPRVLTSLVSAALCAVSATTNEDVAELTALDSSEIEWMRLLISVEMPWLITESVETNEDTALLMALDRENTSEVRVLISLVSTVLNADESTPLNEATLVAMASDNDAPAYMRVLISLVSEVLIPESTTTNEATDRLSEFDTDETDAFRVLTSVSSAVLMDESTEAREDIAVVEAVESEVILDERRLISELMEFKRVVFPFSTVVANEGSFPIAVARSDSVFNVEVNPSPARAATLSLT